MNATKSHKLKKLERVLRIFVLASFLIWVGFLFCTKQYSRGVDWLFPFLMVVVGFPLFDLAVARGYVKVRSEDSWGRIIAVTFVIIVGAIFVTGLVVSFVK